jgi:hypothetical protein
MKYLSSLDYMKYNLSTDTIASSPSGYDFGRYHSFEEEQPTNGSYYNGDPETPDAVPQEQQLPSTFEPPPVWCIDCQSNQIVIGCSNGRLELWEATSGKFKVSVQLFSIDWLILMNLFLQCLYDDPNGIGSTSVKIIGNRVVVAKLNGCLDFMEIDSYRKGKRDSWGFSSFRRSGFLFLSLFDVINNYFHSSH